jgi:hypothetical protein
MLPFFGGPRLSKGAASLSRDRRSSWLGAWRRSSCYSLTHRPSKRRTLRISGHVRRCTSMGLCPFAPLPKVCRNPSTRGLIAQQKPPSQKPFDSRFKWADSDENIKIVTTSAANLRMIALVEGGRWSFKSLDDHICSFRPMDRAKICANFLF